MRCVLSSHSAPSPPLVHPALSHPISIHPARTLNTHRPPPSQDMMLGVDLVNEDQMDKIIGPKKPKDKKTNLEKLEDALGPSRGEGGIVDGVIEGESKTIEDLEAPPAWEADPNDPDSPIDISTR